MSEAARFRFVVVASNQKSGERVTAGAPSGAALRALIEEFRISGLTVLQIHESLARPPVPAE